MILIVCVDDGEGILFFGKRQSQDRLLRQRVLQMSEKSRLLVTPYTAKQFDGAPVTASSDPVSLGEKGDFYFAEDGEIPTDGIERIVLYRWNRRYPADRFFHLDQYRTRLLSRKDFPGSSHENITEEIYEVLK